ncbi:membrane protein [Planotetraspora silvatica]|uniref:Membrane protein n=1 Tax=Planotetraspora silvatica TaxID=234614 RepID=A0A8J3UUY0_9ACTN|nr:CDP-alcohol phosphatidyltransferase family protein [Planotetraspora silvatica]GII45000.1 membrane protein [Planotetraspora silvatica]
MTAPSIRTTPTTRAQFGAGSIHWEQAAGAGVQVGLLGLLHAVVGLSTASLAAGVVYTAALWVFLAVAARRSGTRSLGPADHVTLARALLVGGVTALVAVLVMTDHPAGGLSLVILVTLATVALILDAVDGQVARRTGTVSKLGARFDMEVDAFLILVLSVYVSVSLGAWVLVIGAMRYAFVVAGWTTPWLRSALPPSFARKVVAATQGIVLVVAASGVLPYPVEAVSVGAALASLVWSFGRDVVWLRRNRPARTGAAPAGRASR